MNSATHQANIKSIMKNLLKNGYELQAIHEYCTVEGQPIYWKTRQKNHTTNEKIIRPIHFSNGSYIFKEPKFEDKKPLYNLRMLVNADANEPVYITEGEWCADRLIELRLIATTSGGAQSASRADWSPLNN